MTNTTQPMTLTEFLLARIAEEATVARKAAKLNADWLRIWGLPPRDDSDVGNHVARWAPFRVLAECEMKRRIVERCSAVDFAMPCTHLAHGLLAELALAYSDHSDYLPEWKP